MISGIALTIALISTLATLKYAMSCAAFHVMIGSPSEMPPQYRTTYALYCASIGINIVVTIAASFIAGVYA